MGKLKVSLAALALFGCALLLTGIFASSMPKVARADTGPVEIDVSANALPQSHAEGAARFSTGVNYVGGWVLESKHPDFGGFSGLLLDAEKRELLAINDKGDWWQASFDALGPGAPGKGSIQPYSVGASADKIDLDAESLVRFDEGYLVSFEQNHRLEFVSEIGKAPTPPEGLAPINFAGVSNNSGMEAIALLPSGRLLVFTERGKNSDKLLKAWLVSREVAEDLFFKPPNSFAPTDAATLPNGDVLVLMRRYSPIDGVAVKVLHIAANQIAPGEVLQGREILHLTPEFSVDNMEGLDVIAVDENTVRLVMISDDNFNPLQRTLLMMFDYTFQ